jgi:hypothetical protein
MSRHSLKKALKSRSTTAFCLRSIPAQWISRCASMECILGGLHDRGVGLDGALFAAEFQFQILAPVHAFCRHVRIELERMPFDQEFMLRMRLQRAVEAGFADVAPRADGVGYYV